jgi:hypothetical protein
MNTKWKIMGNVDGNFVGSVGLFDREEGVRLVEPEEG